MMTWEEGVCSICWMSLPIIKMDGGHDTILHKRLAGRVHLKQGYAMLRFYQGGITRNLLHAIKYRGKAELGVLLGRKFGEKLEGVFEITDKSLLVPVPLHPMKLQMRGYNQSEKIADGIAESLRLPVMQDGLGRSEFRVSQTKKGKEARWEEIRHDFHVQNKQVEGKDIILVDDVCTSGATIEACANALNKMQVKSISLLTLAVAGDYYQ